MACDGSVIGEAAAPSGSASEGSRNEGFKRAVAATATDILDTSGDDVSRDSRVWSRSSGVRSDGGGVESVQVVSKRSHARQTFSLTFLIADDLTIISSRWVVQGELLLQFEARQGEVLVGRVRLGWLWFVGAVLNAVVFVQIDLP